MRIPLLFAFFLGLLMPQEATPQSSRLQRQQQSLVPQGSARGRAVPDSTGRTTPESTAQKDGQDVRLILLAVEEGLGGSDISRFSRYLSSMTSLNLRDGESGTFSANQAYYVLENYLRSRRVVGLTLSAAPEGTAPYGAGPASLHVRGGKEEVQVFVALKRDGERLTITQITIH